MLAVANENKILLVKSFLNTLIVLQNHLRLYDNANKMIDQTTDRMFSFLDPLLADENAFTLYVGRHAFIYEGQFIERSSGIFEAFANRLFHHGISAVTFNRGVTGAQVHSFLNLVGRKPGSSWNEGGVEAALNLRDVKDIVVREMSELDFSLEDEVLEELDAEAESSPLWQRFALSIVHGLHTVGGREDFSPMKLAEAANLLLEQNNCSKDELLAKDLSRFLLSLKNEKVRIYRTATLNSLVEFVNALTPRVRDLFVQNVFNLNIDADLSEGLLRGMSDQVIMDALLNASVDQGYAPPMVLQLLGRLAAERGLASMPANMVATDGDNRSERIAELFREDDFNKYVPKPYQKALLAILKSSTLPPSVTENLTRLKKSLENQSVDRHVGEILLQILQSPLELQDIGLLKNNIKEMIDFYLVTHDYAKIRELLTLCRGEQLWSSIANDIYDYLSTSRFSSTLLNDLNGLERKKSEASMDLIVEIGTPFIAPLLDRLSMENNRSVRRLYLNLLTRLGADCVPQAVSRLADSRWFVVRNMLYLLRELGDPDVLQHVRPCIRHPHPKVSQEALKICLSIRDREAVPYLLTLLEGKNEEELIQAISHAALCDDPAVFNRQVALLQEGGFMNFRLELKRAIVRSLASSAPKRSLPVFANILNATNRFNSKQLGLLKLEVIAVLDKIPGDEVKRLLGETARKGSAEVMRAAQAALARSGGGECVNRDRTIQSILDFLRSLSQTLAMAALYSPEHPQVVSLLPRILDSLQQLLGELPELTIIVFNDDLLYQGKPLEREFNLIKLAKLFNRAGIGHVTFMHGVDGADVSHFISSLHNREDLQSFKSDNAAIKIGVITVGEGVEVEAEMVASFSDLSPERLQGLETMYDSIAARQPLDTRQLISMVAGFIAAFRREHNPLMALTPIRNLDDYTFTHSINVGILNIAQGMSLGISGELLHDLGVAGMLHDAGKIFVDRAIIQKPGNLTDEEFAVMQTHPIRGAQYLMGQEGVPKLAVISAFEHHMRYDLKGYPLPPEGWDLNLCSQITMISDTFDALRTKRIYKDPWDFPVVCGHMLSLVGGQLNEDLTINFLDMLARMGDSLPPAQMDDAVPSKGCYCE